MATFLQGLSRWHRRKKAVGLPKRNEAERYGSAGEDRIYEILSQQFSCVVRNIVIPAEGKYLEKDFLVYESGVAFVLEIKNWTGTVYMDGDDFCQDKADGTHKVLNNPAFSTADFINAMENFYHLPGCIHGMVVFADQSCVLETEDQIEGVWVLTAQRMMSILRSEIRKNAMDPLTLPISKILHCTRLYSKDEEFCKGLMSDSSIECYDKNEEKYYLDPSKLKYMAIRPQPLFLRDQLNVIFSNGSAGVFYNYDTNITLCCLDGSCRKFALSKLRYILF